MGYGGIFKKVVRIAIPVVVSVAGGGPWAVALASAATTGATGGSFKDALIAGGTSYIGTSLGNSLSDTLSQAGQVAAGQGTIAGGNYYPNLATDFSVGATQPASFGADFLSKIPSITDLTTTSLSGDTIPFASFAKPATDLGFGGIIKGGENILKSPFDAINALGSKSLAEVGAKVVGGISGLNLQSTVTEALATPEGLDALRNAGFSDVQLNALSNEARKAKLQGVYTQLQGQTPNPGLDTTEFDKIIANGLQSINTNLGPDVTGKQFNDVFGNIPGLGNQILSNETTQRRGAATDQLNTLFSGDPFQPISSDAIQSILAPREQAASQQLSTVQARGSLNSMGGRTANEELARQKENAILRVGELGSAVNQQDLTGLQGIQGQGTQDIAGYNLGDALFNIDPYKTQRDQFISDKTNSLTQDVKGLLGTEKLFNPQSAIQTGGRAQGVVSGTGANSNILDTLSARAGASAARKRRGLGTRGSGVF